jgi:sirohydrochlorin cobaltochelatase
MGESTMLKIGTKRALILLAHGARNPDWAAPFKRVQQMVQGRQPDIVAELAFLEFMQPDLSAAVRQLAQQDCVDITVVPLFLGQSGHVLRDVPPMLAQLQQEFPAISLRLAKAAGEDAGVLEAMSAYCVATLAGAPRG